MPNRLALIDDHKIFRDGLKALLNGMQVVAEGSNGHDTIALAESPGIDVFLMNIALPCVTGLVGDDTTRFEVPTPELDQDAFTLSDMSIAVRTHGKNLTDEEYNVADYCFLAPGLKSKSRRSTATR